MKRMPFFFTCVSKLASVSSMVSAPIPTPYSPAARLSIHAGEVLAVPAVVARLAASAPAAARAVLGARLAGTLVVEAAGAGRPGVGHHHAEVGDALDLAPQLEPHRTGP